MGKDIKIGVPVQVNLSDLKPNEYNPRKLSPEEKKELEDSLTEFGMVEVMVANSNPERKNVLIGGHQRYSLLTSKGEKQGWVIYVDLDLDREKKLNLRLNKNQGSWDWDLLANFSEEMLRGVGFSSDEIMVGFGVSGIDNKVENQEVDPDRLNVITVEPPNAPRLKSRRVFYTRTKEEFDKICEAFKTIDESVLDVEKLLKSI